MTDQLDHSIRTALKEIVDHAPRAADVAPPQQASYRPLILVGATSSQGSPRPARPGRLVLIGLATAAAFAGIAVINSGTTDPTVPNVAMVSPVRFSLTTAPAPAAPQLPAADSLVLLAPETTPAGYRQVAARTQLSSSALTGMDLTLEEVDAGIVVGTAGIQADEEWWFGKDRNNDFESIGKIRIGDGDGELLRNRATRLTETSGQEVVLRYRVDGMPVAVVGYSMNPELVNSLTKVAGALTVAADGTVSVTGALPDRYAWNQRADQAPSEILGYRSGASAITLVVETDARSTDRDWTKWGGIATPLEPTTVGGQVVYVGFDIVVWTERPGVFVQVGGQGVAIDELLAFAGSLSDIDATEWNQMTATIDGN